MKNVLVLSALALATLTLTAACNTEVADPESAGDQAAPATEQASDDDGEENVGSVSSALSSCHPGQVGDTRWASSGCCSSKQRYNLQRCDGAYWRSTVSYKCGTGACAS